MKLKIFISYWLPIILYAGMIFYLSSMPSLLHPSIVPDFTMQDKAYHLIEYFFLSFLILRTMMHYKMNWQSDTSIWVHKISCANSWSFIVPLRGFGL